MFKWWIFGIVIGLSGMLTACAPASQPAPMRVVLPVPTEHSMPALSIPATATVTLTETATPSPSATVPSFSQLTRRPTYTPTFTLTPTGTGNPTVTMTFFPTFTPTHTQTLTPSATVTSTPTRYLSPTPLAADDGTRYADIPYVDALRMLRLAPVLTLPDDHMRRIYQRGRTRGMQVDFLLNIGDCNTENVNYLEPLTYLDDTSESTLAEPISHQLLDLYTESFRFKGQSVNSGLNALSVMDSFWANSATCFSGETPLACDVRITQPFAAVIMFGANDINVLTIGGYETAMRDIIEYLLQEDVIPILSTFSVRPDVGDTRYERAIRFNAVLVQLADEYEIPLINFWREAQRLPDRGILSDNAHLKITGFEIRNQLTIDMLDYIQTNIIEPENPES